MNLNISTPSSWGAIRKRSRKFGRLGRWGQKTKVILNRSISSASAITRARPRFDAASGRAGAGACATETSTYAETGWECFRGLVDTLVAVKERTASRVYLTENGGTWIHS
jgi:hypothetical protein